MVTVWGTFPRDVMLSVIEAMLGEHIWFAIEPWPDDLVAVHVRQESRSVLARLRKRFQAT